VFECFGGLLCFLFFAPPAPSFLITTTKPKKPQRLLLERADAADAVAGTRLHDQLLPLPTTTFVENATWAPVAPLAPAVAAALEERGQSLEFEPAALGVSQAIAVEYGGGDEDGGSNSGSGSSGRGVLVAVSDARKDGAPFAA
jgi:hypothetical protein